MDVKFVITELHLAIKALEGGDSKSAIDAIEIALEEIKTKPTGVYNYSSPSLKAWAARGGEDELS